MHGARAVQKEILEAKGPTNIAVYFVWMPMLPSDSEAAARRFAARINTSEARHFYDTDRRVGTAFTEDHFHKGYQKAIDALPEGSPLRDRIARAIGAPPSANPLWDAVLIFRPGAEWKDSSPAPAWWARQVGFWGAAGDNTPTGLIWKNRFDQVPIESDWSIEVRAEIAAIIRSRD